MISDHERILTVFAELTENSIAKGFKYASEEYEWVDTDDEAKSLMTRFRGALIASICGEIEELLGRKFSSFIDQLPDSPTEKFDEFWHEDMPKGSSLRGRAKTMWAIRIAYTHGNGLRSQIDDEAVSDYIDKRHFRGIHVESDKIILYGDVTFPAVRTAVDIYERFK